MGTAAIIQTIILTVPVIIFAVVVHECAHGWAADRFGDSTARHMGRLTLNPIPHIDPFMTIIMPLFLLLSSGGSMVFGGAKPVPVNSFNLRNPKRDMVWVALAGPVSNLILAFLCGVLLHLMMLIDPLTVKAAEWSAILGRNPGGEISILMPLALLFCYGVKWNVVLAVFNMVPIPPLDGGRVLVGLLPDEQSEKVSQIEPHGMLLLMGIIAADYLLGLGILSRILFPPLKFFFLLFLP